MYICYIRTVKQSRFGLVENGWRGVEIGDVLLV